MAHKISIIVGSFHKEACERMVFEVRNYCESNDIVVKDETWVPGALEVPLALKHQLANSRIDGAVVLGVIEKGDTDHGFTMGQAVISAIIDLQLQFMKPVGVGIMGPGIQPEQISERITPYARDAIKALHQRLDG